MSAADTRAAQGPIDPGLTAQALLYANGELEGAEAEAFEKRLGDEQQAREALCQAVQLTQTVGGWEAPKPDPAYRDRVRAQLLAALSSSRPRWWRTALRPRLYRGHPMAWLLAGAVAACLMLFLTPGKIPIAPVPQPEAVADNGARSPRAGQSSEQPHAAMGKVWAELHSIDHLERVRAEETRRKQRLEERRLAHTEFRGSRGVSN